MNWAHQAGAVHSNGAVVIKSLSGGSYAGTGNPIGAVAKANQNASTQPPTVIIQATAGGIQYAITEIAYAGNLGGRNGGDEKCVMEFGTGWKFATDGYVINVPPHANYIFATYSASSCTGFTSSAANNQMGYWQLNISQGGAQYWSRNGGTCNTPTRLLCTSS